jgi:PTH1 family peptidyl-tRNA hydrolase
MDYYKANPSDLLVIHDDIDLPFGRLRLHEGRGHGGHNGVRSVIAAVGTRGFWRLKVGVGRPPGTMDPATFVLRRFAKAERPDIDLMVGDAAEVVEVFVTDPDRAVALAGGRRPPDS